MTAPVEEVDAAIHGVQNVIRLQAVVAARGEMMTRLGYPVVIMEDWRP